jgi:hypothetical protein
MVALYQKNWNAGAIQPCNLAVKVQSNRSIFPSSVVHISSDCDESDFQIDCSRYEVGKRFAACAGRPLGNLFVVRRKPRNGLPKCKSAAWMNVKFIESPATGSPERLNLPTKPWNYVVNSSSPRAKSQQRSIAKRKAQLRESRVLSPAFAGSGKHADPTCRVAPNC